MTAKRGTRLVIVTGISAFVVAMPFTALAASGASIASSSHQVRVAAPSDRAAESLSLYRPSNGWE
jgi:hypothetical protein